MGLAVLASLLVGWAEYAKIEQVGWGDPLTGVSPHFTSLVLYLAILIGGVTFSGSCMAYLKLSGKIGGRPTIFPWAESDQCARRAWFFWAWAYCLP